MKQTTPPRFAVLLTIFLFLFLPTAFAALDVTVVKNTTHGGTDFNVTDTIIFVINITNSGDSNITELNLTDTYDPTFLDFLNSSVIATTVNEAGGSIFFQNLSSLNATESFTLTLNFTALNQTLVGTFNNASVSAANDSGNTATAQDTQLVFIFERIANISVAKGLSSLANASVLTFQVNITNLGNVNITTLPLNDTFDPTLLRFLAANATADSIDNTNGRVNFNNLTNNSALLPGQTFVLELNFSVISNDTTTNNVSIVNAAGEFNQFANASNGTTFTILVPNPSVLLDKILETANPVNGGTATFTINITNNGDNNITTIVLNDTFNGSHIQFAAANISPEINNSNFLFWSNLTANTSTLEPNQSLVIQVNFTVVNATDTANNITVSFTDLFGTTVTSTTGISFTTNPTPQNNNGGSSGGGGGGGGGISNRLSGEVTEITVSQDPTIIEFDVSNVLQFSVDGDMHTMHATSFGPLSTTIHFQSYLQRITFSRGFPRTVDLNQDGVDDISLTYLKIYGSQLTFSINALRPQNNPFIGGLIGSLFDTNPDDTASENPAESIETNTPVQAQPSQPQVVIEAPETEPVGSSSTWGTVPLAFSVLAGLLLIGGAGYYWFIFRK